MKVKGICYDAGRVVGVNLRPVLQQDTVRNEMEIIKNDLHCNAVRVCGYDLRRLKLASEEAIRAGLEVWFSPEKLDETSSGTLEYISRAAEIANGLYGDTVLIIGSELTLLMKGILKGRKFAERMRNRENRDFVQRGLHNEALNSFIKKTVNAVRARYRGRITYASLIWENVDWEPFDYAGVDHYMLQPIRDRYFELLEPLFRSGKPVVITEFGFRTYRKIDSDELGSDEDITNSRSLIMRRKPIIGRFFHPLISGKYQRDEELQAKLIVEHLNQLDKAGVEGGFVNTFVSPLLTYNPDPRFDLDMSSYSIVKSYDGGFGSTYPSMTWDPKRSFWALSEYYANSPKKM